MARDTDDYAKASAEETLNTLKVDLEKGLSTEEVRERLARYGYNEIRAWAEPRWRGGNGWLRVKSLLPTTRTSRLRATWKESFSGNSGAGLEMC